MTPKKIAGTAALALALAAAAAFFVWKGKPAEPQQPLAKIKAEDLSRVEIDFNAQEIVLEKTGDAWRLIAPLKDEAEASRADELAQGLLGLSIGSEVSRDAASLPDYALDEPQATRVRVYSKKSAAPVLDGWFGKAAMGSSVYFRRHREPAVYLAEGVTARLLRRSPDEWRCRNLMSLTLNELDSLHLERGADFVIVKSSGGWSTAHQRLNPEESAEIVLTLSSLRFTDFATPARKSGLDHPVLIVTASGRGRSEKILIGREDAGRRWVEVEGRQAFGFVAKAEIDPILKLIKKP